jgi:hypothetical protein
MLKFISTTILGLSLGTAVLADSVTMTQPIQAGVLHDGPLDMVAYWMLLEDGGFEVTATYRGREAGDEPMRTVMRLSDGDNVSFGVPGYKGALYRFARNGDAVTVSGGVTAAQYALN